MKKLALLFPLVSLVAAACSDRSMKDPGIRESDPPVLSIEKPARGTVLPDTATTLVVGYAFDTGSGLDVVLVNGVQVDVDGEGRFEATVPLLDGITLIQVVAIDEDANQAIDTRAVLQGTFVAPQTPVDNAGAARVNDATLGAIGLIAAETITEKDLGATIAPYNPVLDKGFTCLEAQLYVEDVAKSLVTIDLVPTWGGIAISADVYDLHVPMGVDFEALCIGGSAGIDLSADRFHMEGTLMLSVNASERLTADIELYDAYFAGFNLDVGFIPGDVIELFYEDVDDLVAGFLIEQIAEKVPEMLEEQFGGFGIERAVTLYGMEIEMGVKPASIDFTPQGGTIVLDSRVLVKGDAVASGPGYLSTPEAIPTMPSSEAPGDGFRLAIADDVLNQALAAFWAAGVLEYTIATESEAQTGLAALIDRVDLYMPFPPTVSARESGAAVSVTAGDVRLDVISIDEATGTEYVVTALAISAEIGLDVETDPNGAVRLRSDSPIAWVDVLEEEVTGPNPLSTSEVELLSSFVVARLSTMIGGIVGEIPIPSYAAARITNLGTQPTDGYLMLGGNVEPL